MVHNQGTSFTQRFSTHVSLFLEIGCIIEPVRKEIYLQTLNTIKNKGINYAINRSNLLSIKEWQQLAQTYWKSLQYKNGKG